MQILKLILLICPGFFLWSYTYEISIAAIFQNEAPYFKEWIEYHRMIGVQHFYLYNNASDDNWYDVLEPYIKKGIIEVIDWPPSSPSDFIQKQRAAYRDAFQRTKHKSKWLALIDTDEFILPLKNKNLTECLHQYFSDAGAIYVNWRQFGTGNISLEPDESILMNLTSCSERKHPRNATGKSIVRVDAFHGLWNPHFCMLKQGTVYKNGDSQNIDYENTELKLDGHSHSKYIKINHYTHRDENFFNNVRIQRHKKWELNMRVLREQYREFSKEKDHTIIRFIRRNHPKSFRNFWGNKISNDYFHSQNP